jgi:hypothetical protein
MVGWEEGIEKEIASGIENVAARDPALEQGRGIVSEARV